MPIVHPCATDGCETLTMGELCLACEQALLDDRADAEPLLAAAFSEGDED